MTPFNPLAMILYKKQLYGNKFEDWKTNLYIVLDYEKIKFVLNTPKPAIPEECNLGECKNFTSVLYSCQCCGSFEAANNTSRQWSRNAIDYRRDVC